MKLRDSALEQNPKSCDTIRTSTTSTAKLLREVLKARLYVYPPQPSYELSWLQKGMYICR
ncbi:hypothetical protein BY996DRAFT_6510881 [Phakopsora pachyrhizi]|nr:hypothetical protein BY996DRAFT_6510881 [Phakopsora pachyrhizi]